MQAGVNVASPRLLSRRDFVAGSAALTLAGCTTTGSQRPSLADTACLPRVQVSANRVIRTVAGLRPYRPSGYRVEAEALGDGKRIVHNYGHGGGGISLSWGSSREAIALGLPGHAGPVAVIGAGALGLTTARLLQEAGYAVRIYAKALPPNTTSNIAGGQIMPASYYDPDAVTQDWLARQALAADFTRRRMQTMVGEDYGIRWLPTYDQGRLRSGEPNPMFPDRQALRPEAHPFPVENMLRYETMYVETGRFLASLMRDIRIAGGAIMVRDFANPAEIVALPEQLVFNCTGLGARALFGDEELEPVRGQLAILIPQPEIGYAYTARPGYMFPRPDGIVLGGTFEHGEWDATPQPADIARILERHRAFAEGWRCA